MQDLTALIGAQDILISTNIDGQLLEAFVCFILGLLYNPTALFDCGQYAQGIELN
jgi:hypothetical protein